MLPPLWWVTTHTRCPTPRGLNTTPGRLLPTVTTRRWLLHAALTTLVTTPPYALPTLSGITYRLATCAHRWCCWLLPAYYTRSGTTNYYTTTFTDATTTLRGWTLNPLTHHTSAGMRTAGLPTARFPSRLPRHGGRHLRCCTTAHYVGYATCTTPPHDVSRSTCHHLRQHCAVTLQHLLHTTPHLVAAVLHSTTPHCNVATAFPLLPRSTPTRTVFHFHTRDLHCGTVGTISHTPYVSAPAPPTVRYRSDGFSVGTIFAHHTTRLHTTFCCHVVTLPPAAWLPAVLTVDSYLLGGLPEFPHTPTLHTTRCLTPPLSGYHLLWFTYTATHTPLPRVGRLPPLHTYRTTACRFLSATCSTLPWVFHRPHLPALVTRTARTVMRSPGRTPLPLCRSYALRPAPHFCYHALSFTATLLLPATTSTCPAVGSTLHLLAPHHHHHVPHTTPRTYTCLHCCSTAYLHACAHVATPAACCTGCLDAAHAPALTQRSGQRSARFLWPLDVACHFPRSYSWLVPFRSPRLTSAFWFAAPVLTPYANGVADACSPPLPYALLHLRCCSPGSPRNALRMPDRHHSPTPRAHAPLFPTAHLTWFAALATPVPASPDT